MTRSPRDISIATVTLLAAIGVLIGPIASRAEEIWLHDNTRIYGLVRGVTSDQGIVVLLPTGEEKQVQLESVVAIRFLGRNALLVQSGTQEFRFVNGGHLRGQILHNNGDRVVTQTAMAGVIEIDLKYLKGFVALPLVGFSSRKAEELVDSLPGRYSPALDIVLNRRGSEYPGVVRRLDRTDLYLDHEDLLQQVKVRVLYLAGVRLADAARVPEQTWGGDVQVRIHGRDGSRIQGKLKKIHLGKWHLAPVWNPAATLQLDVQEIALVQVLGGRVQYLSQLTPSEAVESTILAPPQPYRPDSSCQGDPITIADKRYPWGLGVHADSTITFDLNGRFNEFRSDIGIASRMGDRGSVVFAVLGDGKELFKSKIITGADPKPIPVQVPVKGVRKLTLQVTNADDLDLGDAANWGSARVLR